MSKRYIPQVNETNFVYPNNTNHEYDVNIVHDINDNCVSGTVTSFSATTASSTGITFSLTYSWSKNNAEPFISNSGNINLLSVHMLGPSQNYYKPWRLVHYVNSAVTGNTNYSGTVTFSVTPSQVGLSTFVTGLYYFEIRFIGHRAIFPVCSQMNIGAPPFPPPPTPTPTPTPTATATPTPTPTGEPYCCRSGTTLNVTDTGWVKWTLCDGTQEYHQYTTTGNKVIPECIREGSVAVGIPFADLAAFTVTGVGTACGGTCVTPTPTPTVTPTLPGGLVSFGGCGYGNSVADACNDAIINNRTLYSDCDTISFGPGCFVYTDTVPTPLTGYSYIFMNFQNWDVNSSTGVVTAYSSTQC